MTDREKVLSWLEGLTFDDWRMYHSDSEVQNIAKEAFELLKKQEPMPILYEQNPYTYLSIANCPKCGKYLRQFCNGYPVDETKYCPWCGQAVKWDD